jgi:hypothetical protein
MVLAKQTRKAPKRKGVTQIVRAPAATGVVTRASQPSINNGKTFHFQHREMITTVRAEQWGTFIPQAFIINPGRSMFPWLKQIAPSFDKYVINAMTFQYAPICATSQAGHVRMYIDYDPLDEVAPDPESFSQMEGCIAFPMWTPMQLTYRAPNRQVLYTCLEGAAEDRFADSGTLCWYCESDVARPAGEIWVSYDITFYKPQHSDLTDLRVGGDPVVAEALPGPAAEDWSFIGNYASLVRRGVNLAKQIGIAYDQATHRLTLPAASDRREQTLLVNVRSDTPLLDEYSAEELVRVADGAYLVAEPIDTMTMATDTTAAGGWTAQRAFTVRNTTSASEGAVTVDLIANGLSALNHLETTVTAIRGHEDL